MMKCEAKYCRKEADIKVMGRWLCEAHWLGKTK